MNIFSLNSSRLTALTALVALLALGTDVSAQPTFGNPSPTAGSSTSDKANAAADAASAHPNLQPYRVRNFVIKT